MKKQLLFILTIAGFYGAQAQITITPTDIATPTSIIYRGIDTSYTENFVSPAGTNMTWDFSGVLDDRDDTVSIVDPSTLPNGANYPSANLGIVISGQGTAYAIKDAASLRIIGQGATVQGQPIVADVNPAEIITKFPNTYANSYTNNSTTASPAIPITGVTGVDSGRVTITKTKNVIVDAWGSLTLPMGTYPVIRQKEAISTDQNIEVHTTGPFPPAGWYPYQNNTTTSTSFLYWANGVGFPLVQVDSADGGPVDVTWLIQAPLTGIKEANAAGKDLRVYPNPANDFVYIMLDDNNGVNISVYDVQGKLVKQTEAKGAVAQLNTLDLEKGIYTYKVVSATGAAMRSGKFVIAR